MTIRIEVTGNSLPEVADKLLSIGVSLRNTAINALEDAAREELQAKRNAAPRKAKKAEPVNPEPEVDAPEDVGNGASSAEAPSPNTNSDTSSPAAETAKSRTEAPALDFDKEVAPVVIEAVQRVGKPAVSEVLSEFGVERASELDPSLYGELVDRLKALS